MMGSELWWRGAVIPENAVGLRRTYPGSESHAESRSVGCRGRVPLVGLPAFLTARRSPSTWAWWLPLIWATLLGGAAIQLSAVALGEWWTLRRRADGRLRWRFDSAMFSVTAGGESREHSWTDIGAVAETRDHFLVTGKEPVAGVRTLPIPKRALDTYTTAQLKLAARLAQGAA
jgi:hypothetical protein